ncbi:MAG: hypothetical protein RLZZ301_809 [Bacteroidota bacterium]|jgi:isochorismate synthase
MLHYRFPGEETQHLNGNFQLVESIENQDFIVTDFTQQLKYTWQQELAPTFNKSSAPFCIDQSGYLQQAEALIHDLNKGLADKVVLSRILKATQTLTNPMALFDALLKRYPNAFIYFFEDTILGSWIGASPEIFIENLGERWRTMALAGTKVASEERDFSFKEYHEHAMVTEFIEGQLRQIPGAQLHVSELKSYSPGPVSHLLQELTWQMPTEVLPILIRFLHPTPAVAGLPQKVAIQYIQGVEAHERRLYTGLIGRLEAGREKLYVNLRCAELIDQQLYCYVGGGFTPDSVAQNEWQEGENKSQTLLGLLPN